MSKLLRLTVVSTTVVYVDREVYAKQTNTQVGETTDSMSKRYIEDSISNRIDLPTQKGLAFTVVSNETTITAVEKA